MNGAVYFSLTIEEGTQDGNIAKTTGGVINDTQIDVDADGSFTVYLGGEPRERNWLALTETAGRVTTRHYFEHAQPAALDPTLEPTMRIECLSETGTPAPADDESVSAGIRRVCNMVRSRTLDMPLMAKVEQPPFVSIVPNGFPEPVPPGKYGLAAFDAHYSMAPYLLGPDEALVIKGRWPTCRFGNVCLWNRFQQTYDYANRTVSLNRTQAEADDEGRFTMIIAHEDPGLPNWLDSEGKPFGMVFWRFFLVEGEVETPIAEVVKLAEIRK
jgi:hypothetical protein